MKDLTTGHPGRVLTAYTLPLFGSIIFQQLYNIADSLVAGRWIGTEALAAVGNAYEITLIFIAIAMGCNIGASVITAGCYGQKDYGQVKTCVHTALIFSSALALVLTAAGIALASPLLQAIQTSPDILDDCRDYLTIYLMGYFFLMLYNVATGIFSALGDSQTPFWFLLFSSLANIGVDILFVAGFGMGVTGVAWATFLCQMISGVLAAAVLLRRVHRLECEGRLFNGRLLRRMLTVAVPSAAQQLCISIGNILIQGVINGFGVAATAGYAAAIKLNNMCITSLTALGNGMSNYTAQNLGAGQKERVRTGFRWGLLLGEAVAVLFTAVFMLGTSPLIGLFVADGNADAMSIGIAFLHIVTPFYCLITVKLISDGILRGATRMAAFTVSTMVDLVLRVVLCFALSVSFGTNGIWMSWPIGWFFGTLVSFLLLFLPASSLMRKGHSR